MEELLNLKQEIENLQNYRIKLAHERDVKEAEANKITDKNSNFYKIPIKEAKDIQIKINDLGEKAENLKKKFDECLKINKEEELKRLEKEKAELDKIGLIKKEDRINKIKELKENQKELLADIKKRESSIKELNKRILKQHITNPRDVLMQSLDMSKRSYEDKKKAFQEANNNLKYLAIEDPRAEFLKIEEQIVKVNALNYNNLDEYINNNKNNTDKNLDNQIIEENAAAEDLDIQSQPEKLNKFNERQDKVRKDTEEIKQNIRKDNEETYLTKSLTDLQIEERKSYTETFKEMEQKVDKFYGDNKELLEGTSMDQLNKIMSDMSNDAAMLLERRMRKENYIEDENTEERKSVFNKIKSIFSRNNKETKALTKQSKIRQIFNKIKDKISQIKKQNENDEKSTESEKYQNNNKQEKLGDKLYKEFSEAKSEQKNKNRTINAVTKEKNIDVPSVEHDEY